MQRRRAKFWNRNRSPVSRADQIRAGRNPVKPSPPRRIYGNYTFTPREPLKKPRSGLFQALLDHLPNWDFTFLSDYLPSRDQMKMPYMILAALPLIALAIALLFFVPEKNTPAIVNPLPASTSTSDPVALADRIAGRGHNKGRTDILVLGSDLREYDGTYRTDVIMLVSINMETNQVSVVSFPRDLFIEVPEHYPMKINTVMEMGGFKALRDAFEQNFGVRPRYYVMTHFQGVIDIVDSLDGVTVAVTEPLTDRCDLPQAVDGYCSVEPGAVPMDGATALWFIRSRESTSDYDRLRRSKEVGHAIFDKMISGGAIGRVAELYGAYRESLDTNMGVSDIIPLLPVAARVYKDQNLVQAAAIGENEAAPTWSWDGMWILMPDLEAIRGVMRSVGIP
jgi:LCP family protein required for cell wall assembly